VPCAARIVPALAVTWLAAMLQWTGPAHADRAARMATLVEALRIEETVRIMHDEGLVYGASLARDMMPEADTESWRRRVARIYDPERMRALVVAVLEEGLADVPLAPLVDFFTSGLGHKVVALELSTREAFLDRATEDTAREAYAALADTRAPILGRIETLIDDSDLVERNVTGILNSNLMLYRGLVDGGAYEMSGEDILRDVRAQADSVRADSAEWIGAYLLAAYRPLPPEELDRYIAFWRSDPGRALNRALFATYDRMYEEVSYLLGQSMAQYMRGRKL